MAKNTIVVFLFLFFDFKESFKQLGKYLAKLQHLSQVSTPGNVKAVWALKVFMIALQRMHTR